MTSVSELKARIAQLEKQLADEQNKYVQSGRQKITEMSSEVVDSNPYRYFNFDL